MVSEQGSAGVSKWPSRIFVLIQGIILFLLLVTHFHLGWNLHRFLWLGSMCEWLGILGILVSASNLRSSLTVMPLPKSDGKMIHQGLYQYVRHPMYSSVLLFALGVALNYSDLYKYFLVGSLLILFYFKSSYEESYLSKKYPGYADYARNTPRFLPHFLQLGRRR